MNVDITSKYREQQQSMEIEASSFVSAVQYQMVSAEKLE
jgi:hypothetical protein